MNEKDDGLDAQGRILLKFLEDGDTDKEKIIELSKKIRNLTDELSLFTSKMNDFAKKKLSGEKIFMISKIFNANAGKKIEDAMENAMKMSQTNFKEDIL